MHFQRGHTSRCKTTLNILLIVKKRIQLATWIDEKSQNLIGVTEWNETFTCHTAPARQLWIDFDTSFIENKFFTGSQNQFLPECEHSGFVSLPGALRILNQLKFCVRVRR